MTSKVVKWSEKGLIACLFLCLPLAYLQQCMWSRLKCRVVKIRCMHLCMCMIETPAWLCSDLYSSNKQLFGYGLILLFSKKHWSRFWLSLLRTTALKDSKQSRDSISWCLEPCTLVGWTVKISRHSQAHAWDLTPDVPQSLNIYFLVTLFYPPFALLWWIEVKTTAGKNLFSIHHRGSG